MFAFFGGAVFGALLIGAALAAFINWQRAPRREPADWSAEFHEPQPIARTRLLVRERTFEL